MLSDGVSIGSGTLAGDLGGITIWTSGQMVTDARNLQEPKLFWYIDLH